MKKLTEEQRLYVMEIASCLLVLALAIGSAVIHSALHKLMGESVSTISMQASCLSCHAFSQTNNTARICKK